MGPLYDFDEGGWMCTIDLRTLHTIRRGADGAWMVCWGKYEADVPPDVGAAILAAWRAHHGIHTPAEPVNAPAPQLPEWWLWRGEGVANTRGDAVYVDGDGDLVVSGVEYVPIAVVEAVIAAHRARGVR